MSSRTKKIMLALACEKVKENCENKDFEISRIFNHNKKTLPPSYSGEIKIAGE